METITKIYDEYATQTPKKLQLADRLIVFCLILSALQFVYMKIAGNFPFNAFLAGFYCTLGTATFTICLRMKPDGF
jgi:oligosaccharyltransferase complex subunit epsilon